MTLGTLLVCALAASFLAIGLVAAMLGLHRQRLAARRREVEVERLHDRIWHLAESEERYRALVEADAAFVVQRDADGRITFANDGYAALAGRRVAELVGSTQRLTLAEATPERALPEGGRAGEIAVLLPGAEAPRWYAYVETPVIARGRTEFLRAGRDVTQRIEAGRALEEARGRAEAASVAKSRFLATVSHEFRTPLNGILGMAALARDTGLSAEQRTYVEAIETSGRALLSLIDEILDFSRIEAGRIDLAAEPFDLAALVEGVVELLAPRAQDKGIEIAAHLAPDLPRRVVGDADRVRQILVNLAGNAIKFTRDGGVGVAVSLEGDRVAIAVRDTGLGIAPDRLPALFEEFEQGDVGAGGLQEGTGLGLAITRRLVVRMGGTLGATSEPGIGSAFTATLPLPAAAGSERVGLQEAALAGRRVLVVADSPFTGPALLAVLSEAGAEAQHVSQLADALAALRAGGREARADDAVIADRALGDEAVRAIAQAARAQGIARSFVMLSPFDRRDFGSPAAAGFDGYLVKPVRAASLLARLIEPVPTPVPALSGPRPAAVTASVQGRGPRVLLAEDNEINALLARTALARLGARVTWARDGLEAAALAAPEGGDRAFDLALLDIRMPGLDGLEVARRVRRFEAGRRMRRLRLVALTANALAEDQAAARAAGFDAFLPKPLDLSRLADLLVRQEAA